MSTFSLSDAEKLHRALLVETDDAFNFKWIHALIPLNPQTQEKRVLIYFFMNLGLMAAPDLLRPGVRTMIESLQADTGLSAAMRRGHPLILMAWCFTSPWWLVKFIQALVGGKNQWALTAIFDSRRSGTCGLEGGRREQMRKEEQVEHAEEDHR